ncbi:bacteriocin-associated integral membrane family protein [Streptococcus merionis]|uniref:bacteriocin-associated integral membrane family protein n=1 Tax=Streptococcus merionis TaxID=400065 RepID=UPI0026EA5A6C|nr:DUF1430 domain-containing protein [Streptococcus merionis]
MKRSFVVLSNLLVTLFFVWVHTIWSDTYVSFYYPNISVFTSTPEATFDKVADSLSKLAGETDSLIAMQHQESGTEGTTVFSYTVFGQGKLPEHLSKKSRSDAVSSSLITNYFIFRGKLSIERLKEELSRVGLSNLHPNVPSSFNVLASVFSSGFQLIALLIFLLTFGALSLISQILNLRTAGIRLISGENRWKIFLRPLSQDIIHTAIGLVVGFLFAVVLKQFVSFPLVAYQTIGTGLVVYNLCLLLITLFFAGLFAIGIKKVPLMQVIKGQVPVRGIISLILIGQLLAVIIVSIGVSRTSIYSKAWQQQEQGRETWRQESNLVALSLGRDGVDPRQSQEELAREQKVWFNLVGQAVSEQGGLLSQHNLADRAWQNGVSSSKNFSTSTEWQDYSPQGNVLIVTPQYLKQQQIAVAPEIEEKVAHLATGEFVLLLPEHLRSEESHYKNIFEEDISHRMSSQDTRQEMVATVSYLESGHDRFVYNTTPISYQQFLRDPIIVVLTPQSTGEQSFSFWEQSVSNFFFFENLKNAQALIEKYGIENWVAELKPAYQIHQTLLDNLKREMWTMAAGAILGTLTSILMFNTMNQLYFEEFRRDIFIKRISGLRFWEIHKKYLLAQLFVFFLGFLASIFLATDMLIAFLVLLLFIGNAILQLHFQMHKENKMSTLILKGA